MSYSGWWLSHPSEKCEFVIWDDYSQPNGKIKHVPNHQPENYMNALLAIWLRSILFSLMFFFSENTPIQLFEITLQAQCLNSPYIDLWSSQSPRLKTRLSQKNKSLDRPYIWPASFRYIDVADVAMLTSSESRLFLIIPTGRNITR